VKIIPEPQGNNKNIVPRHKKHVEMMLNTLKGFYNLTLPFFAGRLICGTRTL
jgi:hypothetical protein